MKLIRDVLITFLIPTLLFYYILTTPNPSLKDFYELVYYVYTGEIK